MATLQPAAARLVALMLAVLLAFGLGLPAASAQGIKLIRDAEIEGAIRTMSRPIFEAASLGPDNVNIYLVNDPRLNAFTAGGLNLFLNTGLLMRTEDPSQMLGVVAHEVGHIAGGHISRVGGAQRRAAAEMILATVLGAAAAVAGAPGLGTAIITGGQSLATSNYLRFSRSQEQAADQAAMTYLDQARISPVGLLEFLKILENQNVLQVSGRNPYLQTHPLTRDRILFVEDQARRGRKPDDLPDEWLDLHERMVVKLEAFLEDPRSVLERYEVQDGLTASYARAIAHYRLANLGKALAEIDGLLDQHPGDPYFHELKGQMLFENGRIAEAIPPYRESVRLEPDAPLLRIGLARALLESGDPGLEAEAVEHLEEAVAREPRNPGAWRLLGIAQGRAGLEGPSALSLAESALLTGKDDDARLYARRAEARIAPGDPNWIHLQDVLRALEQS
ncbi:MAG: M48 family metalloprotease [Geminicoccaceae bacterium]|nr:M48 family metalloprotease [Geminicoccaceae bacterium]